MRSGGHWLLAFAVLALATVLAWHFHSERDYAPHPQPGSSPEGGANLSPIHPGGSGPEPSDFPPGYEESAFAISDGHTLFRAMNCNGCHASGGGAIGPALMDDRWIYGSAPLDIFATITQGRPNGMPAFRGKLSEPQIWHLVAYVRSLAALAPMTRRPARDDQMQSQPPQSLREPEHPVDGGTVPPGAEAPQ